MSIASLPSIGKKGLKVVTMMKSMLNVVIQRLGTCPGVEVRPWRGFSNIVITHPHFGPAPVEVFAIHVN